MNLIGGNMFGKINKEEIEQQNQSISEEMRATKPDVKPEVKENQVKNAAGNILSITGSLAGIIAGIGAAILALNYLIGVFGFSAFATILILAGCAIAFQFAGNQMISSRWIPVA